MNKLAILALGLVLTAPAKGPAQDRQKSGSVAGAILNGSRGDTPIAGQEVVLYALNNGQEVDGPRPHVVSDSRGRFRFENLEVSEARAYYPLAVYRNIEYSGPIVRLKPDSSRQWSAVTVFDTTASDSAVSIAMHHIIIDAGKGTLAVREVYQFTNRGKFTYIGQPAAGTDKHIAMRYELPELAEALQVGGDLMSCCIIADKNRIYDTMEFKPGLRQSTLTYQLPYKGGDASFTKLITARTAMLDVYLPEGIHLEPLRELDGGRPQTTAALAAEPFQLRGKSYQRYVFDNLAQGSALSLHIGNLPAAEPDLRWMAPVIIVLLMGASYVFVRRGAKTPSSAGVPAPAAGDPIEKRQQLIQRILELDEAHQAGRTEEEHYQSARRRLIQEVLAIDEALADRTDPRVER